MSSRSLAFGVLVVASTTATTARAQLRTSAAVAGLAAPMPDAIVREVVLPSRVLPEGARVPSGSQTYGLVGLRTDTSLTIDRRWLVPLFGVGGYMAVGPSRAIESSVDGSPARLRPWAMSRVDVLLPGVGLHGVRRRYAWAAHARTGVSFAFLRGSVASGTESVELTSMRFQPLLQVEAQGCRRLDPVQRVCLFVAPRIYDFGWLTGVSAGLSWELGS